MLEGLFDTEVTERSHSMCVVNWGAWHTVLTMANVSLWVTLNEYHNKCSTVTVTLYKIIIMSYSFLFVSHSKLTAYKFLSREFITPSHNVWSR